MKNRKKCFKSPTIQYNSNFVNGISAQITTSRKKDHLLIPNMRSERPLTKIIMAKLIKARN